MSEIKLNQEIITALEGCKDAKEVMALTKSKGIALTEEQAGKVFEYFQDHELTDEELEKVVGGAPQCEPSDVTEDAIQKLAPLDETPFS